MKKIIITGVVVLASLGGIMYVLNNNKTKKEEQIAEVSKTNTAVAVRVAEVDFNEVNDQYVANGTFTPKQEVMIAAETGGRLVRVLATEGTLVKAGQTLAVINADKQSVGVANAQAMYNNAAAEVARFEAAYASGGVTKQQLDQMKFQLETAKNNLKNAQIAVGDVNVRASFAGIVNKKMAEPGAFVAPGQPLFEVVNVSSLKLKVNVDEKNIAGVQVGQIVKVVSNALPSQEFEGKVTFIAPKANAGLTFPVELEIKNNQAQDLKAGMYGTAYFGSNQAVNTLVVPRSAFVGSVSSNQMFVVKDGKAVLKKVVAGEIFGDFVEVLSGVEKGEKVVTTGQINLLDGTAVQIIK